MLRHSGDCTSPDAKKRNMGFGVYWVYIVNSEVNSVRRLKGFRVAAGQLQKGI